MTGARYIGLATVSSYRLQNVEEHKLRQQFRPCSVRPQEAAGRKPRMYVAIDIRVVGQHHR